MKKISIFVAGAKDLELQRLKLKALVNDMNADYLKNNQMIHINVHSYENFENNNQNAYNHFIVNEADLAIFVLDGRIGEKTELEYLLAAENFRNSGIPKVLVFVKKYDELTPDIAYINGLLKSNSDDYYTTYENDHDLMSLARRSIEALVDEICSKPITSSQEEKIPGVKNKFKNENPLYVESIGSSSGTETGKFRNYYKYMTMVLLPLCIFLVCMNFFPKGPNPHLLIAGGGSAANFITL